MPNSWTPRPGSIEEAARKIERLMSEDAKPMSVRAVQSAAGARSRIPAVAAAAIQRPAGADQLAQATTRHTAPSAEVILAPGKEEEDLRVALESGTRHIVYIVVEYLAGRGSGWERLADLADQASGGMLGRGEVHLAMRIDIRSPRENDGDVVPFQRTMEPNEQSRVWISDQSDPLYGPGYVSVAARNNSTAAHVRLRLQAQPWP